MLHYNEFTVAHESSRLPRRIVKVGRGNLTGYCLTERMDDPEQNYSKMWLQHTDLVLEEEFLKRELTR